MSALAILSTLGCVVVFVLLAVRPSLGIGALLAIYPVLHYVPRSPVPGLNAETILLVFAMILTLGRSGLRVPPLRVTGPVLAFLAVMFMAWVIGRTVVDLYDPLAAAWERFKTFKSHTFAALLFFIAYWCITDRAGRRTVLEGISLAILGLGASVLLDVGDSSGRASGLFQNANTSGDVLGVFLVCPLFLVWTEPRSKLRRGLHGLAYLVGFVGLVYTLSRGAWLAFAIGHLVFFLMLDRRVVVMATATAALMLAIGLPLAPQLVRDRLSETFEAGSQKVYQVGGGLNIEGSAAIRVVVYRVGFDMFLDSPIWGHGSGGFRANSLQYGAKYGLLQYKTPHSLPLMIMTEAGGLGLISLAWLSLTVLGLGLGLLYTPGQANLGVLILTLGIATGVANLFHTDFLTNPVSARYFWVLFGMCSFAYFGPREPDPA